MTRILSGLISAVVIMIVSIFILVPMFYVIVEEIPDTPEMAIVKSIGGVFPIFIIIGLLMLIFHVLAGGEPVSDDEVGYYVDSDDVAVEPKTLTVRDAKKILKIRFAKGEISSEEYTERMARL